MKLPLPARVVRKHKKIPISVFRKIYGADFAPGSIDSDLFGEAVKQLDTPSMDRLLVDHKAEVLDQKVFARHCYGMLGPGYTLG